MANQAAKKAAKAQGSASNKYLVIIVAVNVLYLFFRFIVQSSSTTRGTLMYFAITSGIYWVCYHGLVFDAGNANVGGGSGGYFFDGFCVAAASQVVSTFSDRGPYILVAIPGYTLSVLAARLFAQWKASRAAAPDLTEQDKKRQEKKERKQGRQKIRMVR